MRLPPPTYEQKARAMRLMALVAAARKAHEALSPVDRALEDLAQRNSFVRGQVDDDVNFKFNDPASILAAEVRRLRTRVKELEILIHEDAINPHLERRDEVQKASVGPEGREAQG